jgi:UDPglucose--hexose-1-phosphate uridylyltransferase
VEQKQNGVDFKHSKVHPDLPMVEPQYQPYKLILTKPDGRPLTLYSIQPIDEKIKAVNPPHIPLQSSPHLRWHPLRTEWVAYASHRNERTVSTPSQYSPFAITLSEDSPTELPKGNYDMAVFENLFPSFSESAPQAPFSIVPTKPAKGICEVIVYSQNAQSSGSMSLEQFELLIRVWGDRYRVLGCRELIDYVFIFENRGAETGVTLHHPHGQIYGYPFVPPVPAKMLAAESSYFADNGRGLLEDIIAQEIADDSRLLYQGKFAVAFVPAFARYPYEVWVAPRRRVASIADLQNSEISDFAKALKTVLLKYDGLWGRNFPYSMNMYQAPTDQRPHQESHFHIEFCPPYRSKDQLKYLAGSEIGAGLFINDSTPELKAKELQLVDVQLE